jgi:hypothetical protein
MKKNVTLLFALLFMSAMAFAQAPIQDGEKQVNVGIGLSNYGLPIYAGADFGIGNNISVGGELSYRSYKESYFNFDWSHTIFTIAGNGNYHFNELLNIPSNIDFYAGLSLGYSVWNTKYDGPGGDIDYGGDGTSGLYFFGQVGGRYFFKDNLAANVELGGGSFSGVKVGITYKL